jgi:hypothetical protein
VQQKKETGEGDREKGGVLRGGGRGGGGHHHRFPHRHVRRTNIRLCSNPSCVFYIHRDQQCRTCTGTPYSCGIAAWSCSRCRSPRRSPSCLPGRHVHVQCFLGSPPPWQAAMLALWLGTPVCAVLGATEFLECFGEIVRLEVTPVSLFLHLASDSLGLAFPEHI